MRASLLLILAACGPIPQGATPTEAELPLDRVVTFDETECLEVTEGPGLTAESCTKQCDNFTDCSEICDGSEWDECGCHPAPVEWGEPDARYCMIMLPPGEFDLTYLMPRSRCLCEEFPNCHGCYGYDGGTP